MYDWQLKYVPNGPIPLRKQAHDSLRFITFESRRLMTVYDSVTTLVPLSYDESWGSVEVLRIGSRLHYDVKESNATVLRTMQIGHD
ncbi:hypothetical protein DPMN_104844 [Dreissena polymorpha]|uniref:Uncharacterized protein n=1 Tax=Dreissena polymorpha TaxID=45954 RepID=A0A9D4K1Y6_DREPO|nr:hypothetical protein DPMN_104844 [Dreissena polymorpha]